MPYPNSLDAGNYIPPGSFRGSGRGYTRDANGVLIPPSNPGGIPSPISGQSQRPWYRPQPPTFSPRTPTGQPPVNSGMHTPAPPPAPLPGQPPITSGFQRSTTGGVPPQNPAPAPAPNQMQQDRYNQLAGIDPNVLWAYQYNIRNNLNTPESGVYGSHEAGLVESLLPPRLAAQVHSGAMTLQGALGRYLQFLRASGVSTGDPVSAVTGGSPGSGGANPITLQGAF